MAKTCLKRWLFDDRNDVFWTGFGFWNSGGKPYSGKPASQTSHPLRLAIGFRATPKASTSPKSFFKGFTFCDFSDFGQFPTLKNDLFSG